MNPQQLGIDMFKAIVNLFSKKTQMQVVYTDIDIFDAIKQMASEEVPTPKHVSSLMVIAKS